MKTFDTLFKAPDVDTPGYNHLYVTRFRISPSCADPNHPGCPVCEPDHRWHCYRLTPTAQEAYDNFITSYGDTSCACHTNPPCGYCVDPGNPTNLLEDATAWMPSTDPTLTSFDVLYNQF